MSVQETQRYHLSGTMELPDAGEDNALEQCHDDPVGPSWTDSLTVMFPAIISRASLTIGKRANISCPLRTVFKHQPTPDACVRL